MEIRSGSRRTPRTCSTPCDGADGEEVASAIPERRPAAILSELVDANGRPVSILLVDENLPDGEYVEVDEASGRRT